MGKIILEGWRDGFEKINFTKIQMDVLGKSLKESKENTDLLLDHKIVVIESYDLKLIKDFVSKAKSLGVKNVKIE